MNLDTAKQGLTQSGEGGRSIGGLAGWLLAHLRRQLRPAPRIVLRERIALGPRQHVSLIEVDGRCFLIVTAPDASPAFHPLGPHPRPTLAAARRVSW